MTPHHEEACTKSLIVGLQTFKVLTIRVVVCEKQRDLQSGSICEYAFVGKIQAEQIVNKAMIGRAKEQILYEHICVLSCSVFSVIYCLCLCINLLNYVYAYILQILLKTTGLKIRVRV